jgi:holo-[acyl-carrier protein] synthase
MRQELGNGAARLLRVGLDLAASDPVRESIDTHGDRYLHRVFTPAELRDCTRGGEVDPCLLAARFAAKEAAFKVLDVGDRAVSWRDVEVRCGESDQPDLALSGSAAKLAQAKGIRDMGLSLAHARGVAVAVVVATAQS